MEYMLSLANFDEVQESIHKELTDKQVLIVETKSTKVGKWGMARLWRSWMDSTAKFMADNGVTQYMYVKADGTPCGERSFNADDAHLLFTKQWLGVDEKGVRLSWSRGGRDGMRAANKGERLHAMLQHEQWCSERGIVIFQPRESEYRSLQ